MRDYDRRHLQHVGEAVVQEHNVQRAAALRALHDATYYRSAIALGIPKPLAGLAMLITAWATEQ